MSPALDTKGLEWPRVRLAGDFWGLEELHAADRDGLPCLTPEERDQELHLLYVAATRARQRLEPNAAVRSYLAGWAATRRTCAAQGSGRSPPMDFPQIYFCFAVARVAVPSTGTSR
jgi:hypothetical protein